MKDRKIHIGIGTKAQLIKMAPIMHLLEKNNINYNFIFTGQHKETIDKLLSNFKLKNPDVILHKGKDITGIIQMIGWLIKISFRVIFNKKKIFGKTSKNDVILTHGDTFSTVLVALMGKLAKIKVAHIESGLRSFNIFNPFPEELNRLITFRLSDYFFCPGRWAINNLKKYKGIKINTKMNTLYDALTFALKSKKHQENIIPKEKFCLFSTHRFENIFNKKQFVTILEFIKEIKEIKILFIAHPPTMKQIEKLEMNDRLSKINNLEIRPRYDYFDFISLLKSCEYIITDGGSNQEESYYLGKPCLLLRKATERKEGLDKNVIISNLKKNKFNYFINNYKQYSHPSHHDDKNSPSQIIINSLININFKNRH